jgi:hypothetical protein
MLMVALIVSNFSIIGSHHPPLCERRNYIEAGAPGWPLSKWGIGSTAVQTATS